MQQRSINLRGLVFLIADPNAFIRKIVSTMLRSFGALSVIEASDTAGLFRELNGQRIDLLLLEASLRGPNGELPTTMIRQNKVSRYRTLPILITTGDTRESVVRQARDCGANMMLAKPISPRSLYDHLAWAALNHRPFFESEHYFGPDRRFKIEGYPDGTGRRTGDQQTDVSDDTGPALEQTDIDSLFKAAQAGLAQ